MSPLERFQELIRELLQVEYSDLDFGLYRLLRLKRDEVEAFIAKQLPDSVDKEFAAVADAEMAELKRQSDRLAASLREEVNEGILNPDGSVNDARAQGLGRKDREKIKAYSEVRSRLLAGQAVEADKADVFNHLFNFFSRYYEDGDFIPKRRLGDRGTYAVPWDGSETMFYWANKDQHYVKTAETLKDYAFTLPGDLADEADWRVRFVLVEASVPKDNVKGEDRFFFPRPDAIECDVVKHECRIGFEYRPPTEQEIISYRSKENARKPDQDKVLTGARPHVNVDALLKKIPDAELRRRLAADTRSEDQKRENKPADPVPLLLKRLRHFVKRSTSDFFVHKNLKRFLTQELEFYIKDQVLHLGDIEGDLPARLRMVKVFRRLAGQMIEFLAQIEDAQKRLFEKKKFITETSWLIPIQNVPERLWPDVVKNKAQLRQWKDWLAIEPDEFFGKKSKIDMGFLKGHPTLVADTRLFPQDWTRALLESLPYDDLDEATDGLLVHSENYQALRLLLERYREQVKCIHIDPPYNTGASGFLYKNSFQHSSWLTMMMGRVLCCGSMMAHGCTFLAHIDENEVERLRLLLAQYFGYGWTAVWDKLNPMMGSGGLATQHEYVLLCANEPQNFPVRPKGVKRILAKAAAVIKKHGGVTAEARRVFRAAVGSDKQLSGGERVYKFLEEDGRVYRLVAMTWPNPKPPPAEFFEPMVHPKTGKPCPVPNRGFSLSQSKRAVLQDKGEIVFGPDETTQPQRKVYLSEEKPLSSIMRIGARGREDMDSLGLGFPYSHPVAMYELLLDAGLGVHAGTLAVDYFAGSGTTGHAVINLNREDGGQRKFVLVEMGDYFDTVLVPRLVKVMYSPEWKDGRPKRQATKEEMERTPRLVKVLRLESYEDALHNVAADATQKRADRREKAHKAAVGDAQYRIRYLVKLPLEAADTMVCLEKFEHPFSYTLEILTDDGPKAKQADLVETFNYLYGLRVKRYETWRHGEREYRVVKATDREQKRRVLVLWRDMAGLKPAEEREFIEAKLKEMEAAGGAYDEKFINGDCAVPGISSLDPLFKRLMTAGEEGSA